MPNWCENDLWVRGPASEVARLLEKVRTEKSDGIEHFDFDKIIPYPSNFRAMDDAAEVERTKGNYFVKDGYNQGGYDWCIKNWGTKWPACNTETPKILANGAKISFSTPWGPPVPVLVALSKAFPKTSITLKWYEKGMGRKGVFKVKDCVIISDTTSHYSGNRGG